MGWVIELNGGQFTFNAPSTRFSQRTRQEILPSGLTDYREELLIVEGEIIGVGATDAQIAADVEDKWAQLRSICFNPNPLTISAKLDGVEKHRYDSANGLGTPKCRELVNVPSGADHASHLKFTATFWQKTPGRGGSQANVTELVRESGETYENGKLQSKYWAARAKAKTFSQAKALVLSYKPSKKPLTEEYVERIDQNEFQAKWTWNVSADESVFTFRETVDFTPSDRPLIPAPLIGTTPFYHKGRLRPGELRVTMEEESTDPSKFFEPAEHVKTGKDFRRDRTKESGTNLGSIFDSKKGVWVKRFVEFYYCDSTPTQLNHADHENLFPADSPGNGSIGGSQGGMNK